MTVIGDVLRFAGRPERIARPDQERFVTIGLHGSGARPRVVGAGKTPVAFTGYRVRQGQFIYSRIDARNGAFALVPPELDGAVVSKDFPIFEIDQSKVDPRYLLGYMTSSRLEAQVRARSLGATNRQRISEELLLGLPMPLPSLGEQRRIAAILGAGDGLLRASAARLQVLRHIGSALFLRDIGDPDRPYGKRRRRLGDVADVMTGNTPPRNDATNYGVEVEWIKSGNIVLDRLEPTAATERLSAAGAAIGRTAAAGDLLVVCIAGSPSSIGRAALLDRTVAFNQQINAISLHEGQPRFLLEQLRLRPDLVRRKSTGGMKGLVSKSALQSVEVLWPSMDAQEGFVSQIEAVDAWVGQARTASERHRSLVRTLRSQAFSGGL